MADHSATIAKLEAVLRSGARSVNIDGVTVQIDPESIRRELRKLRAQDDTQAGRRPFALSMNLTGATG